MMPELFKKMEALGGGDVLHDGCGLGPAFVLNITKPKADAN